MSLTIEGGPITPDIYSPTVSYFGSYPAGTYQIAYINGALKYNPAQGWALNAWSINPSGYIIVYSAGTLQFPGSNFVTFPSQAAVEAYNAGISQLIVHSGGSIGMFLTDTIYGDNLPGNPNPTFGLTKIG
jgi:hypothetical protein